MKNFTPLDTYESRPDDVKTTFATSLVFRLREAILSGVLEPGSRLRLDALRKKLDLSTSRSPLREALSRLGAEGLVRIEDNRGYQVMPVSEENLLEVAKLRILLESYALREALLKGDRRWEANVIAAKHELDGINRTDNMSESEQEAWEQAHDQFHFRLIQACEMPLLLNQCINLHNLNDRYRRIYLKINSFDKVTRFEHQEIMEAALARNEADACRLLENHIQRTTNNIHSVITELQERYNA